MPSSTLRDQLHRDGFVVIRGVLSPTQLVALQEATARADALGRSGAWPHVRTVGKQFPPWDAAEAPTRGIWGVQGLNDPALSQAASAAAAGGEAEVVKAGWDDHAAFLRAYFGDEVLGPAKELMAPCDDDDLVMELHNLLVRPSADFELRWHRDDVPPEATAEEELAKLGVVPGGDGDLRPRQQLHAQWNLALRDGDDSLVVVPGSHRRARTETERAADPYAESLPGQLVVHLDAGDAVFYNNNILHRGRYSAGRDRDTLHGSVGHAAGARSGKRATNVLQHGVGAYVDRCDFAGVFAGYPDEERLRKRAEGMRDRLVELGKTAGADVGFSLKG